MSRSWMRQFRWLALAALTAMPTTAPGQDAPAAVQTLDLFTQAAAPPVRVGARIIEQKAEEQTPASEFWIGIQLEPLPELVTSQLKLERGMVVVHVFEESPAAKAGFQVNDIVLRAGDTDVKEPQDLISAVNGAQEKELVVVALRSGTETTLKVTPAKRSHGESVELAVSPDARHSVVVEALDDFYKQAPGGNVRLFAVRPGAVFAYTQAAKFPSNLEIRIEKRGDKPATIQVKRIQEGEDKVWEVSEDKLDELPEDIRAHVQQVLGGEQPGKQTLRLKMAEAHTALQQAVKAQEKALTARDQMLREYRIQVQPSVPGKPVPVAPPVPVPPIQISPSNDRNIQVKLDAILKKLDQNQSNVLQRLEKEVERLRKEVEELRQEKK